MKKREQVFAGVTVTGVAAKITAELEIFKRKPDGYNHNKNPTWLNPSKDELKHIYDMTVFAHAYEWVGDLCIVINLHLAVLFILRNI